MQITEAQFLKLMGILQSTMKVCAECSLHILTLKRGERQALMDEIMSQHNTPLKIVEDEAEVRKIRTE